MTDYRFWTLSSKILNDSPSKKSQMNQYAIFVRMMNVVVNRTMT
jgi:hypothetical protein